MATGLHRVQADSLVKKTIKIRISLHPAKISKMLNVFVMYVLSCWFYVYISQSNDKKIKKKTQGKGHCDMQLICSNCKYFPE